MKNQIAVLTILFFIAGCGTTSKKLIELAPLAENAPVQMFWSQPNIKYESVCEIEAKGNNSFGGGYTQKEDFEGMFKKEARKCGANGVIFGFMHGYRQGSVTATATGILIKGESAKLTERNQVKAFSLAIQSKDFNKVKEIIKDVPKDHSKRAPTDDEMINLGLYMATLDGMNCDKKIVTLLEKEYGGRVTKFKAVNFYSAFKPDSNAPLCNNVVARSFPKMQDKSKAIVEINNHYVDLLNRTYDKQVDTKAGKYSELLTVAVKEIASACLRSSTHPVCATKGAYLDFANKSKSLKLPNIKKNAKLILGILN